MEIPATRGRARPRSRRKRERRLRALSAPERPVEDKALWFLHTVLLWDCWHCGKLSPSLAHIHSVHVQRCMHARLCTALYVCACESMLLVTSDAASDRAVCN